VISEILFRSGARPRALALAGFVALAAAGCGRIGPLEPPPGASAPAQVAPQPGSAESMSPMVKPKIPPITAPNQPFILDPLLK
jgi:predicted small lipoprotein YifL